MNREPKTGAPDSKNKLPSLFAALFGALLALALLKFGNPPIMEKWVTTPTNIYEFLLGSPWPIQWAYTLLGLVGLIGCFVARRNPRAPRWLLVLPVVWLVWQSFAASQSVDPALSRPTLHHLAAAVLCFYLGYFCLSQVHRLIWFWLVIAAAMCLVLAVGWEQHFGGLEQTRRYFYLYIYPTMKEVPPEYLKKLTSNRIFSTLFYPNSLAGALLLFMPPVLAVVGQSRKLLTYGARAFLLSVLGVAALASLYWSGSKGGWLLALLLALIALLQLRFRTSLKIGLLSAFLLLGLVGFFWKYSSFFEKGATSVGARFDYWQAATRTALARPLLGTGPGTFSVPYKEIKRPESEMTRLVHNDYLEQASDSGFPGFLAYAVLIVASITLTAPRVLGCLRNRSPDKPKEPGSNSGDWLPFCIWLGVVGWALQGLVEFSLYIPALAWAAFGLTGFLLGSPLASLNTIDKPRNGR